LFYVNNEKLVEKSVPIDYVKLKNNSHFGLCRMNIIDIDLLKLINIDYIMIPLEIQMNDVLINKLRVSKDLIMLHEKGHCVKGLDHIEAEYYDDGCIKNLMAPYFSSRSASDYCFNKYKEVYMQQYNQDSNVLVFNSLFRILQ
jgi:hypothetical protein